MVHFLWKVGDWFPKWKGEAFHLRISRFSLLDSQVIRIFCLKDRLIILMAVMYVIRGRMCSRATGDQSGNYWLAIFLETVAGWKRKCPANKSRSPLL